MRLLVAVSMPVINAQKMQRWGSKPKHGRTKQHLQTIATTDWIKRMWESEKEIQAAVASFAEPKAWRFTVGARILRRLSRKMSTARGENSAANGDVDGAKNCGAFCNMNVLTCPIREKRQARRSGGALWQWQKKIPDR